MCSLINICMIQTRAISIHFSLYNKYLIFQLYIPLPFLGSAGGSDGKEPACQYRRSGFHPWVRKIPWRRKWQPTPVLLPGEFHEQWSLAGYSPWGHKESDTTELLTHTHTHTHTKHSVVSTRGQYVT